MAKLLNGASIKNLLDVADAMQDLYMLGSLCLWTDSGTTLFRQIEKERWRKLNPPTDIPYGREAQQKGFPRYVPSLHELLCDSRISLMISLQHLSSQKKKSVLYPDFLSPHIHLHLVQWPGPMLFLYRDQSGMLILAGTTTSRPSIRIPPLYRDESQPSRNASWTLYR
jgi:hypothetical protein